MNIIYILLKNKLVRILGIFLVLYFGLLRDKSNPESLGNRLSKERLQENIAQIHNQSQFIISTIKDSQDVAQGKISVQEAQKKFSNQQPIEYKEDLTILSIKDEKIGEGENSPKCNDEADISYEIYLKDGKTQLDLIENQKILIGSHANYFIEENLLSMKLKGVRVIDIPKNFQTKNTKLASLLKFNEVDLVYKITLNSFRPTDNLFNCAND